MHCKVEIFSLTEAARRPRFQSPHLPCGDVNSATKALLILVAQFLHLLRPICTLQHLHIFPKTRSAVSQGHVPTALLHTAENPQASAFGSPTAFQLQRAIELRESAE